MPFSVTSARQACARWCSAIVSSLNASRRVYQQNPDCMCSTKYTAIKSLSHAATVRIEMNLLYECSNVYTNAEMSILRMGNGPEIKSFAYLLLVMRSRLMMLTL